jgi:WD40 repeat protein
VPLTALQADPAHEEWGPGVANPGGWWSRLGVDGIGDLQRLPVPPSQRRMPAYRATLQREFGEPLHRRMPQLLGRDHELAEIAAFATGGEEYQWLVGGAFTGKTALLYETVTVGLPDEVDVVCYFLSRRASDASSDRFLEAIVPQLAYLCDMDPSVANVNVDQYHALWRQAADRAEQNERHLLLVVDGLDEDLLLPGKPSVASLLPTRVGAHAHVLVASRPGPELPGDVLGGHPLQEISPAQLEAFRDAQELATLAKTEIDDLAATRGDDADLAIDILGFLTAAAGPLSARDLVALRSDRQDAPTIAERRHVRRIVEDRAALSLERVGTSGNEGYQFAHYSLLEHAHTKRDLRDPEYRQRIHRWAQLWRESDWPTTVGTTGDTPRYLLDRYPATLVADPDRLVALVSDIGWVDAAIQANSVDAILAHLCTARVAAPRDTRVPAIIAALQGQIQNLRPSQPVTQPGYVLRQLWLQFAEFGERTLAANARARLLTLPAAGLIPEWTTRRLSHALITDLGHHDRLVRTLAVLPDGRVVSGSDDKWIRVWDPEADTSQAGVGCRIGQIVQVAVLPDGRVVSSGFSGEVVAWNPGAPDASPAQIGQGYGPSNVAALPDGRVVVASGDGELLVLDPADPGADPVKLGRHGDWIGPRPLAVLPDGRVVSSGGPRPFVSVGDVIGGRGDGPLLVWDPATPGADPVELGQAGQVLAVAVLADGRLVTARSLSGQLLVWDPGAPDADPAEAGTDFGSIYAVAVLPDGRLVTGGHQGEVLVWNLAAPDADPAEIGHHDGPVFAVAVLPDGRVVTGGDDGRVLVWDPAALDPAPTELQHQDEVWAAAILADGRVMSKGGSHWHVWDPAAPAADPIRIGHGWGHLADAVAVLPDGRVVSGGYQGEILVWDLAAPDADPVEIGRHDRGVDAVAVLPDGRMVGVDQEGWLLIWDPKWPGAAPVELGHHERWGAAVALAELSDGRVVTGNAKGRVLVWDPAAPGGGPIEFSTRCGWLLALSVLPDGRVISGDADGRVLVWDPAAPRAGPVELGRHDDQVLAVAGFQNERAVSGGKDRKMRVWDIARATEIAEAVCSVRAIAVAAGPATDRLLTAHAGQGMTMWSIRLNNAKSS